MAVIIGLLAVGCTGRAPVIVDVPEATSAAPPPVAFELTGVALVAQPYNQYLFAPVDLIMKRITAPPMIVQPGTVKLQGTIAKHDKLAITPLPSTKDTAAIGLQETAGPTDHWGYLLTPALRAMFKTFADDTSFGAWLIVVDDVIVLGGPDGVPLTAYRWPRTVVEAYASCGIPPAGLDTCTNRFYQDGEEVYLIRSGQTVGQ
jgi:hypothetical protein